MIEVLYAGTCLAMLVIMLFLVGYSLHALWIARHTSAPLPANDWPKAALIIPCKGMDPDLEGNLRRHFQHDYPDYQIVFAVADADDPACAVVRRLIQAEKARLATLVIAPRLPDCVEKVSNQLAALAALPPDVAVVVCSDSDGLPRDCDWLRSLVAGLERCSIVSGFRWYIPVQPSLVGYLQSAWDSTWCLLHALGKTTWGGAMAFTADTCKRLRIEEHLRCALTDDLVLQQCTKRAGEKTGFTPGAMVISEPVDRLGSFFRFAVRQSQIIRMVTPGLWLMGFLTATVYGLFFALSVGMLLVDAPRLEWLLPVALLVVAIYYLVRGFMDYCLAKFLFPGHPEKTARLRWAYYWSNPLADLLAPLVAYSSLFCQTVRWRGVRYRVDKGRVVRLGPTK